MSTSADVKPLPVSDANPEFVKALGLTSATTLVMGSMIGSGIFIVSAEIAREGNSPGLLLGVWLVTAFMTIVGALSYGELAAMMPRAGGQYIFLREALGPLWGFLYGWTLFLVIQTGTIAAVGVAFGRFLGHFFPNQIGSHHWIWHIGHIGTFHITSSIELGNMDVGLNTENLAGIIIVVLLTAINIFGIKTGAFIQNVFTIAKVSALFLLIVAGVFVGRNAAAIAANFTDFWRLNVPHSASGTSLGPWVGVLTILAVGQVGSLFSADAWNNVTFTAAEVKNPKRNLPLALALGTGVVTILYVLANVIYLCVLPLNQIQNAPSDRVGTLVMQQMFPGTGASLMAIAILISTFGCCNGLILAGARVYYAMAKDALFFKSVGSLNSKFKTPAISLVVQGIWTCVLCVSGSYNQLLNYVIFAVLVFYILTIGSLFVLRYKRPDAERPYRAVGYPVLPAIYIVIALFIDVVLLRYQPQYTWPGLFIVLLGIPVYLIWAARKPAAGKSLS